MEDKLISFETAKLAMIKDFDVVSESFYGADGVLYQGIPHKNSPGEKICSAPTQSLLQKWLREKTLYITISPYWCKGGSLLFTVAIFERTSKVLLRKPLYTTYEEALEVGLQEALKLI